MKLLLDMLKPRAAACMLLALVLAGTACTNSKSDIASGAQSGTKTGAANANTYVEKKVITDLQTAKPPDYWPTQQWRSSTPEAQGIDSAALADIAKQFAGRNIHSAIVVRNGYIVMEGYNSEYDAAALQDVVSVTKTLTGALTGIAIGERKLNGTDQKVSDFYPNLASDPNKSAMTLGNLLTMTSGLQWDNTNERSSNEMVDAPNWVQYVLNQPAAGKPGQDFNYSNGNAHVVGAMLQRTTGMSLSQYAKQKLFDPLGIQSFEWYQDAQNLDIGAFSLHMTARDMAKFGLLYLQDGKWENKQVVPSSWVESSVRKYTDGDFADGSHGGYGYFMWLKRIDLEGEAKDTNVFYAAGSGGQRIYVVPELNIVAVFTGYITKESFVLEKFINQLVQTVKGDKLSDNPSGQKSLQDALQALKNSKDLE